MSLQFVLGGSGSGKSHYLYETLIESSVSHPEVNHIVIVPEQFTMETQKQIVTMHPRQGVMNIDIVSFLRLAFRIFEELSLEDLEVLDDMGKSMVLRKVAGSQAKELGFFSSHLKKAGFIAELKSVLSEFFQYGVTTDRLSKMIAESRDQGLLHEKLKDLAIVFQSFKEYLEGHYITSEEILEVLCRVIPESGIIRDSVITLDGYTGFTPVQYRLLALLLRYAKKVMITVTIDLREIAEGGEEIQDLFYLSKQMLKKLSGLADEEQVRIEPAALLGREGSIRYQGSKALAHLERNILRFGYKQYPDRQEEISIHCAADPLEECSFAAGEIFRLVMEEGYRYQDIAVITGDVAGYRNSVVESFEAGGIPFFLDDKHSIMGNPMVEVIRAAITVLDEDFSYESVFRYLKTGMTDISPDEGDLLENYVIALGIRGNKRWQETWERVFRSGEHLNLEEINRLRENTIKPLLRFRKVLKTKGATTRDYTQGLFYLIVDLNLKTRLEGYQQSFEQQGEFRLAMEYGQTYELVIELFDKIVALMGEEVVTIREFRDILDAGFEEIKVGVIPATIDRVVVGDIERTRLSDIKALFFIGVNDGIVPGTEVRGGLLSDMEREFLAQNDMELAPTAKKNSFIQKYYLYLLLTKPKKRLYLTFAKRGRDGGTRRPSYLIGMMKKLYRGISIIDEEAQVLPVRRITTKETAFQQLISGFAGYRDDEVEEWWKELYQWFRADEDSRELLDKVIAGAFYRYEEMGISKSVARALYGAVLSGSVTRLERYASCAFAHFLSHGLELLKRQEFQLATVDLGNIFHSSIDLFFKEFQARGYDLEAFEEEERRHLVAACVRKVSQEYSNTILNSNARNRFLLSRVEKITDRTVWALGQQLKKGDFLPTSIEVAFSATDALSAATIALSEDEQMHLKGRIDRLDTFEDENHVYVKIIDYKSGSTSFDLAAIYFGLQLQLVVYMDAALELERKKHPDKKVIPAGIFYYNIKDPVIDMEAEQDDEAIEEQILKELKMNGLVNRDEEVIRHLDNQMEFESSVIPVTLSKKTGGIMESRSTVADEEQFDKLKTFVHKKLEDMGREILAGDVTVNPYKRGSRTPCEYCDFKSVCGFDLKAEGYRYRRLGSLKPEEIWSRIWEEEE